MKHRQTVSQTVLLNQRTISELMLSVLLCLCCVAEIPSDDTGVNVLSVGDSASRNRLLRLLTGIPIIALVLFR